MNVQFDTSKPRTIMIQIVSDYIESIGESSGVLQSENVALILFGAVTALGAIVFLSNISERDKEKLLFEIHSSGNSIRQELNNFYRGGPRPTWFSPNISAEPFSRN